MDAARNAWSLEQWLTWQQNLHVRPMDLGLERVREVWQRLVPDARPPLVITVAGTNGKGSCVAAMEALLLAQGVTVASYTSPHLLRYNERVRIAGQPVDDAALCGAFAAVEAARGAQTLTYFEFGTLAALWLFHQQTVAVWLLEVGLGGRLDAVNIIDPDVAVITSIDLDHQAWLGPDRASIAREKAGIARAGRPVICADPWPPETLPAALQEIGAVIYMLEKHLETQGPQLLWQRPTGSLEMPVATPEGLLGRNLLAAIAALEAAGLPCPKASILQLVDSLSLPGRRQHVPGPVETVLDVAHNPAAVQALAADLQAGPAKGRTFAVVGMLADKAWQASLAPLATLVDHWLCADLPGERGGRAADLVKALPASVSTACFADVAGAWDCACAAATPGDRIVVFGSFLTVEAVLKHGCIA